MDVTLIYTLEYSQIAQTAQQRIDAAAGKAVAYLENQIGTITDDYVLSLASYALQLANSQQAATAYSMLDKMAIKQGRSDMYGDI